MTYHKIDPRLWDDPDFVALDDSTRLLWLVLLSGPQASSLPGLQRTSVAMLAETLRRSSESVREGLGELSRRGMATLDAEHRVLCVHNAPKYNPVASINHLRGWVNRWHEIPECPLKYSHLTALKAAVNLDKPDLLALWKEAFAAAEARALASVPNDLPKVFGNPSSTPREGDSNSVSVSVSVSSSVAVAGGDPPAGDAKGKGGAVGDLFRDAPPANDVTPELTARERSVLAAIRASGELGPIVAKPVALARALADVAAYPGLDPIAEVKRAGAWLLANPRNAKKNGAAFLTGWFNRAQERGPRTGHTPGAGRRPWTDAAPVGTDFSDDGSMAALLVQSAGGDA